MSQINSHDIALALPNNLVGYVPLTSISEQVTERLARIVALESHSDPDKKHDFDGINLRAMFRIGQYLRAYVFSTSDDTATEKVRRRIQLSLRPMEANFGLTLRDLVPHSMIMTSVISVEDHGLIMDLGIDSEVRGFMPSTEIDHTISLLDIEEGAVFLCMMTGLSPNGRIVYLSADNRKVGHSKKPICLSEAPTVNAFLPGTAVEFLISEISPKGVIGKVMGMIDVTADLIHSGVATEEKDVDKKYKPGGKLRGRVICTFATAASPKLGISLLEHVMSLSCKQTQQNGPQQDPLEVLQLSSFVEEVIVKRVEPGIGLFVDVGVEGVQGFVHISRISDEKTDITLKSPGPYNINSVHRGRIIGYNSLDGIFLVSLEQKILDQAFLRIEDLTIGQVVKGKVERLVLNANGVGGLLVNLANGITGLVPEMHMADVALLHPERKFKEGMNVTARVLSTNPDLRKVRLTLKKALVNSEALPITSYSDVVPGMRSPGTLINILPSGAVVQFYGPVRGFLPVSEMSEAYIEDPNQHFRIGQVINVHVLEINAEEGKLILSCKDHIEFGPEHQSALEKLKIGDLISATVVGKSSDDLTTEVDGLGLRAVLPVGHLSDGSDAKNISVMKRIRIGQKLQNLMVIEKRERAHLVILTNKSKMIRAAKDGTLLKDFCDVKQGKIADGFVRNITETSVFVQFGGGLVGLLPKTRLPAAVSHLPDFGLKKFQSLAVQILSVDQIQRKFLLSAKDFEPSTSQKSEVAASFGQDKAINPIDDSLKAVDELVLGKLTKAKIVSVKETQLNVQLADNIHGRIDVSHIFDSWEDIKDRKHPLRKFTSKQVIGVRVLGIHDARNHRFLPITHRAGKTPVFELSAKPSDQSKADREVLTLDKIKVGTVWIAFINNIDRDCLWVNLSTNVRGRLGALEISDDISSLDDLESNFPIGSAIRVQVIRNDISNNRLDLSARSAQTAQIMGLSDLSRNMVVPAKVTRVDERQVIVQLSENVSGPVHLPDLADDYSEAAPTIYSKNDIIRVCVVELDVSKKRIRLSTRPSRVLNSSLPIKDLEITSIEQLKVNDIVRGFVKHIADNGIFVILGGKVTAYVRVSELSDSYLKDWKSNFQIDQLVKGKVILCDPALNHVQMSLRTSVIENEYVQPLTFNNLKVGQIVKGRIRKVEDFGVFIVVDRSLNVSGLCHKTEMAEDNVASAKKLYEEGDIVRAKILKIDLEKRRVNFGLKASYFSLEGGTNIESEEAGSIVDETEIRTPQYSHVDNVSEDGGINSGEISNCGNDKSPEENSDGLDQEIGKRRIHSGTTLDVGLFDWTAGIMDNSHNQSDEHPGIEDLQKKRNRKTDIKIDRTGDLDANGPQSVSDFERLLMGQPDSSQLWIEYMAFQIKVGELAKARNVAERAIRTIHFRNEAEKMNVWIALLNLENAYGNEETLGVAFRQACQFNDPQEMHERLTSIYIQSGKNEVSLRAHNTNDIKCANNLAESGRTFPDNDTEVLAITKCMV